MEMKLRGDNCATVTGEKNSEEGYCWLAVWITFTEKIPYEFSTFMQEYMVQHGVKSKAIESYYEVGIPVNSIHNDTLGGKKLLIEFTASDTEYSHFEEYFEGEEFLEFMEAAIKQFKYEKSREGRRTLTGEYIMEGHSHCPWCQHHLPVKDNPAGDCKEELNVFLFFEDSIWDIEAIDFLKGRVSSKPLRHKNSGYWKGCPYYKFNQEAKV